MRIPGLTTILILFLSFYQVFTSSAQKLFTGSFMMTFTSSKEIIKKDPPMFWNVDSGKVMMEIQDEMYKKGVSKRVLFTPADSTWTMIMHLNKVKEAVRVHANAMFRDTMKTPAIKISATKEKKIIEGYECKKIIIENKDYRDEAWIAQEVKFDLCKIYKMLCHCGLMGEFTEKGNWYLVKKPKGMVLEVTSKRKDNGNTYTMNISEFLPGSISGKLFDLKDFKFSEIPEGQNCGAMVKEKSD
ncbi:MAG TPA: DUF4412 domain-containing protein [Bacteroidia bacterium]|nr:DUF4412 domain-containing protein [Bacteroidia bacterium]